MNYFNIMKYNLLKKITMLTLIFTIILSISFNDLFMIWFILEINNFLFIFILSHMKNKKMIFFYFFIQIISSTMLIFSLSINYLINLNNYLLLIMYFSLMIKLGIPPFHFWMIMFTNYISYMLMMMLLTIQKIIPFYMLSLTPLNIWFTIFSIIFCSIIPPIMSFNLLNLKKIITYSSINQTSWMIVLIKMKSILWFYYIIFYSITLFLIMILLMLNKMNHSMYINNTLFPNLIYLCSMLNMASMPPFSFFFLKWMSIFIMMNNFFSFLIIIIMVTSSLIMLYIYLNIINLTLFISMYSSKLIMFKKFNFLFFMSYYYSSIIYLFLFSLMLLLFIF